MWAALASFALSIVKWLFGGRQQAEGEAQGQTEQQVADANQELKNVEAADDARNSVSDDPSAVLDDPFNAGPAKQ